MPISQDSKNILNKKIESFKDEEKAIDKEISELEKAIQRMQKKLDSDLIQKNDISAQLQNLINKKAEITSVISRIQNDIK